MSEEELKAAAELAEKQKKEQEAAEEKERKASEKKFLAEKKKQAADIMKERNLSKLYRVGNYFFSDVLLAKEDAKKSEQELITYKS